jgi:hypothetical protein
MYVSQCVLPAPARFLYTQDKLTAIAIKLEDLFVNEKHRGKGTAKAFFRELGKIAQEKVRNMSSILHHTLLVTEPYFIF